MGIKSNKVGISWNDDISPRMIAEICLETLIVWTESNGTDMALSFQEAEGCAAIWWVIYSIYASFKYQS